MATQSIFHNIIISDPKTAENFVTALEKSSKTIDNSCFPNVSVKDLPKEEIKNFLGVIAND